jgi:uncharacterized membrane protein
MFLKVLFFHLFCTFGSVLVGYYLFIFSKKPIQNQKVLFFSLCALLFCSAVSGIFLNLSYFSPFHILSAVTILTIPLVIFNFFKAKFLKSKQGLFYNFVGLNIAMIGAFEPGRYIGRRISLSELGWQILFGLSVIIGIYFVIQANKNSKFFE